MVPDLKNGQQRLSLGVFAGDLGALKEESTEAQGWGVDVLHFDVMDGVFVPQFTGGPGFLGGMPEGMALDAHLMVRRPVDHVEAFVKAGSDIVTVHVESEKPAQALRKARMAAEELGKDILAGYALMPGTDLSVLDPLLASEPDIILVLALDPRTADPADVTAACERVRTLKHQYPDIPIAFDGGVTLDTISEIGASGAELIVSGSAIMKAPDRPLAFRNMNTIITAHAPTVAR